MPKYTYFAGNFIEEDILNACYSPNNNPPLQEVFTSLRKGDLLLKHGRSGRPKTHFFRLISSDTALSWRSSTGSIRQVNLRHVTHIVAGQSSSNCFKRWPLSDGSLSFSLHYGTNDNNNNNNATTTTTTNSRTLDLTCSDQQKYNLWFNGLNLVCSLLSKTNTASSCPATATTATAAAAATATATTTAATATATATAAASVTEYIPGDLLLWGSSIKPKSITTVDHHCHWERNATPSIAPFNSRLDVVCAAVGRRHALVATSCGSVYVWGEGGSGRCGLGHDRDQPTPRLIKALSSSSSSCSSADHQDHHHHHYDQAQDHHHVVEVACSDEVSAAVTSKGELFMWGKIPPLSRPPQWVPTKVMFNSSSSCSSGGNGNNTGGPTATSTSGGGGVFQLFSNHHTTTATNNNYNHNPPPARNSILLYHHDVKIKHISCASFHCAAVDQGGGLWTWGEGFGGKLGHGDQESRGEPQLVEAFCHNGGDGKYRLTAVSCGVWHTAAIAIPCTTTDTDTTINTQRGVLFTWGGVNESIAFGASSSSTTVEKRDSNHGCLGLGDSTLYTGSLLPRPVIQGNGGNSGVDMWEEESITSVAAGSHLTVVVTASGRVYQMGSTGARVNSKIAAVCPWEGSTVPEQVKGVLTGGGWFIEHVSCGMHHVVASGYKLPVEKKVSGTGTALSTSSLLPPLPPIPPQSPKYTVFTWGRGSEGQLGRNSSLEDCITPTAILGDGGGSAITGGTGGGTGGTGGGGSNTSAWSSKGRVIHSVAAGGANSLAIIDHDIKKYDLECSKEDVDTMTRQLASKLKETKGSSCSNNNNNNNNNKKNNNNNSGRKKGAIATTFSIPQYENSNYSGGPPSSSQSTDGGGGGGGIGGYLSRVSHSSSSIISLPNLRASGSFTTLNTAATNNNNNNIQQQRMSLHHIYTAPSLNEPQLHHHHHHPLHHYQVDTPTPTSYNTTSIFSAQESGGRKSYPASSLSMSHKTGGGGGGASPPPHHHHSYHHDQQPSSSISSLYSSPAKTPTAGADVGLSLYNTCEGGGGGDGGMLPSPQSLDEVRAASLPLPLSSSSLGSISIGGLSSRPRRYHVQPINYHNNNNNKNNDPRRSGKGQQEGGVKQEIPYKDNNYNEDNKGTEISLEEGRNRDEEQQLIALKQAQLQNQQERLEKWAADLEKKEAELREKQVALESQLSGMHLGSNSGNNNNSGDMTPPPPPPPSIKGEGGKLSEVEIQPGVILVLSSSSEDGSKVKRIRFSGSQFTKDSAAEWYEKNQGLIMEVVARQSNNKQKQGVVSGGGGERGQGVGDVIGGGGAHKNNFSFDAKELASFYENVHRHR